jgi:hypothetical protein
MPSSGILRCVAHIITDVTEDPVTSIIILFTLMIEVTRASETSLVPKRRHSSYMLLLDR